MLSDTIPPSAALSKVNSKAPSPKPDDAADETKDELEEEEEEAQDEDDDEDEVDEEYDSDGEVIKKPAAPAAPAAAPARQNKKPARKSKHKVKKEEIERSKNMDSVKRFSYLIGQTDLFKHFIDRRVSIPLGLLHPANQNTQHHRKSAILLLGL